jgi:hypothetical protein
MGELRRITVAEVGGLAMTMHLFDHNSLLIARRTAVRDARALPIDHPERNQRRQVARSLKRLIEVQQRIPAKARPSITYEIHSGRMVAKLAR